MDTEKRKELLENGKYKDFCRRRREAIQQDRAKEMYKTEQTYIELTGEIRERDVLNAEFFGLEEGEALECERIRRSRSEQRRRVQEHLDFLLNQDVTDVYFATFTFTDEYLNSTKPNTRKQRVRRLLRCCDDYILNVDYGKENGREHYHAIISLRKGSYTVTDKKKTKIDLFEKYASTGFYSLEKVKKDGKSAKRLARYETKLTMHSVKVRQQYISVKKGSPYQQYATLKGLEAKAWNEHIRQGLAMKYGQGKEDIMHPIEAEERERRRVKNEETTLFGIGRGE